MCHIRSTADYPRARIIIFTRQHFWHTTSHLAFGLMTSGEIPGSPKSFRAPAGQGVGCAPFLPVIHGLVAGAPSVRRRWTRPGSRTGRTLTSTTSFPSPRAGARMRTTLGLLIRNAICPKARQSLAKGAWNEDVCGWEFLVHVLGPSYISINQKDTFTPASLIFSHPPSRSIRTIGP